MEIGEIETIKDYTAETIKETVLWCNIHQIKNPQEKIFKKIINALSLSLHEHRLIYTINKIEITNEEIEVRFTTFNGDNTYTYDYELSLT